MNTVLGIDLGTQSLKVLFYDYREREFIASSSSPLEVRRDRDGRAEQESGWWLQALRNALDDVPEDVRASVQAIGVSGQQHGFVPVDNKGAVLAPVKLWCDTSTQPEADEITRRCGGRDKCIELTGNPVLTGYTAPKILWLKKNHPDHYRKLAHILLPHDYLNYVLTGRMSMEYGDASGTGLLDVRRRQWSREMLQAIDESRDLAAALPPLLRADEILGFTTEEFSQRYGLPAGVPVAPGGGDNMMAAIGTGNVTPGKLTMSLGTSGTVFAYSETPVVDAGGDIAAFCSSTGGWLPLLCTMNCTYATEQIKRLLSIADDQFDDSLAAVAPGSDGLIVLPFFSGERTPNLPRASASILGLNEQNCTKAHILRATVEGATYGIRFGLDQLKRLGIDADEIVLTGGGAKSRTWSQIVANICQLPVTLLVQNEGASFGAALQALWILERRKEPSVSIKDVTSEHLRRDGDRCKVPDKSSADTYDRSYADYLKAIATLRPLFETSGVEK